MGFNLDTYRNQYAFTFESETLGRIRIWAATSVPATRALRHHFPKRKGASLRDFMLFLLSITAAQENPENPRHREELLTQDQLSGLSDGELDTIAAEFLKHHNYLFEGQELAKNDQESNAEFLRRVVEGYCKTQYEAALRHIDQMSVGLSKAFLPDLSALTQLNSSIASRIDSLRNSPTLTVPYVPNPQHKTNALLDDIRDISTGQKDVSAAIATAISELGTVAGRWEADAKEKANDAAKKETAAAKRARFNNIVAVIALIVAIVALVVSFFRP